MPPRHGAVTTAFRVGLLGLVGVTALAGAGCASDPPAAPHPLHAIPEGRARQLIAQTFASAGLTPEDNRAVDVRGRYVNLDVAAVGHKYGVAYLTPQDWAKAGDALPPRPSDGALVVAVGDGATRILCLYADDYGEDDDTNAEHRTTTIAADRRLERDVRDFIHRAEAQRWP
jgi:hypothetical protein